MLTNFGGKSLKVRRPTQTNRRGVAMRLWKGGKWYASHKEKKALHRSKGL